MPNTEQIMAEIRKWHLEERQSNIKRTFALGDMIITAIINTKLCANEIIRRIMADLGEMAMGQTSYCRAERMARVFTRNQRQVLIDKMVSLEKCEVLAGAHWDGRKRTAMIERIKSGKTKSPWGAIQGLYEATGKPRPNKKDVVVPGHTGNPDIVQITVRSRGQVDRDAIVLGLRSIKTQIPADIFTEILKEVGGQ
jgi:hypothetical protein